MKEEKQIYVDQLKERVSDSDHLFVADYSNMQMDDFNSLRGKLTELGCKFHVVKNTLAKMLIESSDLPNELIDSLKGQNALVFGGEDTAGVAKAIKDFGKESKKAEVKAGFVDGNFISKDDFLKLANLPSKEILHAQLLGVLIAPASKLVRTFNEPASSLVRVLNAKSKL